MIHHYVDASTWAKRHLEEAGSRWAERLFAKAVPRGCATLGLIETMAALARRQRTGAFSAKAFQRMSANVEDDVAAFTMIDLTSDVVERALELTRVYTLRGADTVHLASAMTWRESLVEDDDVVIVTSDGELADAARHAGFAVLVPEIEERKKKK